MKRALAPIAILFLAGCGPLDEGPKPAASVSASAPAPSSSAPGSEAKARRAPAREGGAIARALENDALFIADEDHEVVRALALPADAKSKRVDFRAPGRPAEVVVTGDRVLVTIRQIGAGEGALLALRRKSGLELEEVERVSLPADAWGITITPDEKTALVTSAWTHRLTAIDLATLAVKWSVDVAREPRGIVILPSGDRAYVSHLIGSDVTRVDGIGDKEPTVKRVELPAAPLRSPINVKLPASLGYSIAMSPDGDRVYLPRHALGALGPEAWFGTGAVDVLSTANDSPLAPSRSANATSHFASAIAGQFKEQRWLAGASPVIEGGSSINAPRAVVYRKKTSTLLVVNEGTHGVMELDARAMDPTLVSVRGYDTARAVDPILGVAEHGEAPSGIALSEDESVAYVFCRATDDVVVLDLPPDDSGYQSAPHTAISLGSEEADKPLRVGRALFYDAINGEMSGGLACAGCHPEGRDDGHVWHEAKITLPVANGQPGDAAHFTNFFGGSDLSAIKARWGDASAEGEGGFGYARQTPMLAGRVKAKGPYGWHGESSDLPARILAGFGLHRWSTVAANDTMKRAFMGALVPFLREGLVPPPRVEKPLTEEEQQGRTIFMSPATQCATCHVPQTEYTDRNVVELRKIKPPSGFAEDPSAMYKVPSLLFVGGSAPYMHDGRFESLDSLIAFNQDRMGKTAQLSAEDKKALIAFLRTL